MKLRRFSRRDFLKAAGITLGAAALACNGGLPTATEVPTPTETPKSGYSLPFFLAMTGLQIPDNPSNPAVKQYALGQLQKLLNNSEQADNVLGTILSNQLSISEGNIPTEQAFIEGRVCGLTICSDARGLSVAKLKIPAVALGESTERFFLDSRQIGAQPSLFPPKVTRSLFFSHEVVPVCDGGIACGFLGGVEKAILLGDEEATVILQHHGVPPETIDKILAWKKIYGGEFLKNQLDGISQEKMAEKWAQVGGHIQAFINGYTKGEKHLVLYGVQTNATSSLKPLGYVNESGVVFSLAEGQAMAPDLAGAAQFFDQSHPTIETFLKQRPNLNVLSSSQFGPQAMFGDGVIFPENAFVVNQLGGEITTEVIDSLIANQGYSIGALEQRAKIIYLVADNADNMAKTRQALFGSSFAKKFLKDGGLIVELTTNEKGLFNRTVVLRNLENPLAFLTTTLPAEEAVLLKNGVKKIIGNVRIAESGETIQVVVKSAVDNKEYLLNVPKGSAYSAITVEALENAGLPVAEALWYEKCFAQAAKVSRALGKVGMVVGLAWMAYDTVNYGVDLMGYGKSIQLLSNVTRLVDFPNKETVDAIGKLGLENSVANSVYEGGTNNDTEQTLIQRINVHQKELATGPTYFITEPYYIRLDNPSTLGIPLIAPDEDMDYGTPIKVTPNWHDESSDPNNHLIVIDSITYANTTNGEEMTFNKKTDGTFEKISGPDSLNFSTVIVKPNSDGKEFLSIPLKFYFDDQAKQVICPNYAPLQETSQLTNKKVEYTALDKAAIKVHNIFTYFLREVEAGAQEKA